MATAFTVEFPKADTLLLDRIARCRPEAIGKAIREDLVNEVKAHLGTLDESRANAIGGRRTHFYGRAANSVTHELSESTLTLSITERGLRQRFLGGPIRPQSKKWITIPARAEAYGKRAGEFNNLRFIQISAETALLIEAERSDVTFQRGAKKKNVSERARTAGGLAMFILKKSVTQRPDPTVLPGADRLADVALASAKNYVESFSS